MMAKVLSQADFAVLLVLETRIAFVTLVLETELVKKIRWN